MLVSKYSLSNIEEIHCDSERKISSFAVALALAASSTRDSFVWSSTNWCLHQQNFIVGVQVLGRFLWWESEKPFNRSCIYIAGDKVHMPSNVANKAIENTESRLHKTQAAWFQLFARCLWRNTAMHLIKRRQGSHATAPVAYKQCYEKRPKERNKRIASVGGDVVVRLETTCITFRSRLCPSCSEFFLKPCFSLFWFETKQIRKYPRWNCLSLCPCFPSFASVKQKLL